MTVTTNEYGQQNMFAKEPTMYYENYGMLTPNQVKERTNGRWAMVGIVAGFISQDRLPHPDPGGQPLLRTLLILDNGANYLYNYECCLFRITGTLRKSTIRDLLNYGLQCYSPLSRRLRDYYSV